MLLLTLPAISAGLVFFVFSSPAGAVQSIPYKMNFQGRLTDSSGNAMAAGSYNMKFRIYDAASSGTLLWSEQRANSASTGVTVTAGGLFSVQLGDVASLSPSLFNNPNAIYFEIELPTPVTATCTTAACEAYSEGPMTPRNKLGSSAYAFNSDLLDGMDSAAFGQVGANNTWSGTQLVKVTSASAIQVQNATGGTLLSADTVAGQVLIGSAGSVAGKLVVAGATSGSVTLTMQNTATPYTLSFPAAAPTAGQCLKAGATTATDLSWGTCGSGGGGGLTRTVTLIPEYAGGVLRADGSNNSGTMTSSYDATNRHNYYLWSSGAASLNDYDIVVRSQIPSDYASGFGNLKLWVYADSASSANNDIKVSVWDSAGTSCSSAVSVLPTSAATWTQQTVSLSGCSFTADSIVTASVQVVSRSNNAVRVGELSYSYTN